MSGRLLAGVRRAYLCATHDLKNRGNMGLPLAVLTFSEAGLSEAIALFMACSLVYFTFGKRKL